MSDTIDTARQTPPVAPQAYQAAPSTTTIHIHADKSVGIAIILTVLLGPLGMFYSTVVGGIIMTIVSFLVAIFTFGIGLLITWPICIIWAAVAVKKHGIKTIQQ